MHRRPSAPGRPRLTAYGLWLVASRFGGPLLAVLVAGDLARAWWG